MKAQLCRLVASHASPNTTPLPTNADTLNLINATCIFSDSLDDDGNNNSIRGIFAISPWKCISFIAITQSGAVVHFDHTLTEPTN